MTLYNFIAVIRILYTLMKDFLEFYQGNILHIKIYILSLFSSFSLKGDAPFIQ